jgi:hypothetical protein
MPELLALKDTWSFDVSFGGVCNGVTRLVGPSSQLPIRGIDT